MSDLSITESIMDSVLTRLREHYGEQLEVDYYPQDPAGYRLNHPVGAVLLGYSRSQFGGEAATDASWVPRELLLPLTLVFCQLNGSDGVIAYLDRLRETLLGFTPAHCDVGLRPVTEYFVSQTPGIWVYGQEWATRTVAVQTLAPDAAPLLKPFFEEED